DPYIERIHKASFKSRPQPAGKLTRPEISGFEVGAFQEGGTKPSCPLPYELEANIRIEGGNAKLTLEAGNRRNKDKAAGGAFNAYSYGEKMVARAYAVRAGDVIDDTIAVGERSHVRVDGPNGFMRELKSGGAPVVVASVRSSGSDIVLTLSDARGETDVELKDESYGAKLAPVKLKTGETRKVTISTRPGKQWYDFSVSAGTTVYRFAGRVENGKWTTSDPAMG
ncbi:MAG TPA: phospholipase domain-containing protein, partial [Fimbriimonas sp.]|nr:phospholipase domain-containing protein [Fimbriimonas sp.]